MRSEQADNYANYLYSGYAAGIYTTNSAEACFYCMEKARANICVVQDKKQLDKVLSVRSRLPKLKAFVQWEGAIDTSIPDLYTVSIVLGFSNYTRDSVISILVDLI